MDDSYRSLDKPAEGIFRDRNSRFMAFGFPVTNVEEIHALLNGIRKKYHDARHCCYAYRLGLLKDSFRLNDDGEPSGTAGKPIYGQLVSHDVTDILAVVVRYFGGTLLGKGGLINAYRSATADMLLHAVIVQKFLEEHFRVRFPYDRLNAVMKVLKEENLIPRQPEYDAECILNFMVRKHRAPRCAELLKAISGVMLETQK